MKKGGKVIYSGPIGHNSYNIIKYFEVYHFILEQKYIISFPKKNYIIFVALCGLIRIINICSTLFMISGNSRSSKD